MMGEFLKKYSNILIAVVVVVNSLIAAWFTIAIERRPVDTPGLVLVIPDDQAVASIPESIQSNHGGGFLAAGLMGVTAVGLGVVAVRRGKQSEVPVEAKGLPGIIGKIGLNIAIRYLEYNAPRTPNELDDQILELLILLRDSNLLDLLAIKEAIIKIKENK